MPSGAPEKTSTAKWSLMADTMTPPMGVLGRHVVENLIAYIIRKGAQQTLTDWGDGMRDRSGGSLRTG
jgi:hypothetical protein